LGGRKGIRPVKKLSGGILAWLSGMRCRRAKGHGLPKCLVCNRQQWACEGPGACKITSIAVRRSTGGSSQQCELKASVSNEGQINCLVSAYVGLPRR